MLRNVRDGFGIYICADKEKRSNYEYIGAWKNNLRDGDGKCYFYNGDLYVGDWKAGKRHGKGDHFYRKGERYTGDWKSDYKEGFGTLVSSNGAKFIGRFKQDKKHGTGKMVFPDSQTFEEIWQYGILSSHKKVEDAGLDIIDRLPTNTEILNASLNRNNSKKSETKQMQTKESFNGFDKNLFLPVENPMLSRN